MKIAFDLRPLQIGHQNRGIGTYVLNILQDLPGEDGERYIFVRYEHSNPIEDYGLAQDRDYEEIVLKRHRFSKHPVRLLSYALTNLFPAFGSLRRLKPDVFVQFDYLLGAPRSLRCKVVTVSYDLIPFKLHQYYLPSWRKYIGFRQLRFRPRVRLMLHAWLYQRKYNNGVRLLRRSKRVISISRNTTKDLVNIAHITKNRIVTIPLAASFRKQEQDVVVRDQIKKLIESFNFPYLTFIGGTDKRREIDELVYAFNLYSARQKPIGLVFAGNEFKEKSNELDPIARKAIETSSYKGNIHMLGRITESEKRYILEHAAAFVYPTLYEGFGLPVLEAMDAGCPVITYRNSSIPEIAGTAALYVDSPGGYAVYQKLLELLGNKELSNSLRKHGQNQAKKFSWDKSNGQFWAEIKRLSG